MNLSDNKIVNANIFENVEFKELKELNLSFNRIGNLKVLEKAKFNEFINLYISISRFDELANKSTINNLKSYYKNCKILL